MLAGTTLGQAWPLFELRIRSPRLVLRLPTDDDLLALLDVAVAGIHEPGSMPFGVAWSTRPRPTFDREFLQHHWLMRGRWTAADWNLNLVVEHDGQPIGSQSVHGEAFAIHRTVDTGSWLGLRHQGQGLGKEMRTAVLAFAFDGLGARVATSSAFLDNAPSNRVSRSLGYEENGRGALAPEGVSRETQRFRMTVDAWRSRPRPPISIEGIDGCRDLFGA
ncbi:MAG: GNAT family N-acetyltransferase [Chloroflexi bacterium]|nr:GNAT family N-acetyltransferase [Chloroflexota bacterium]